MITGYTPVSELTTEKTDPDPDQLEYRIEVSDDGLFWEPAVFTDDMNNAMEIFAKKAKHYLVSITTIKKGLV